MNAPDKPPGVKLLLIVDDDPASIALMQLHLAPLGHRLVCASDEQRAMALFDAELPDLVLLDFVMPGIGGLGVLAHIRTRAYTIHVPVILVTMYSEREHRLLGLQAGADEFLEKPIDGAILLTRVNSLLALRESQDELRASRDFAAARALLLERLQREQRELTQFIVHDLKSQLSVVLLSLDCAQAGGSTLPAEELAQILGEGSIAAQRLLGMVEDLVAISRLEDSSFPLRAELVPLDALLCSVLAAYALEASGRSIMLAFAAGTDSKLWADPALLRRVLENVLDNAFRHTPDTGHIAVDVQLGEHVEIVISNNGPPIPLDERERIFEKFVRGRAQVSTNGNAGLGLYFCKRAMEAHGGGIRVREIAEWPASFVLHLPRSGARVAQPRGALPA